MAVKTVQEGSGCNSSASQVGGDLGQHVWVEVVFPVHFQDNRQNLDLS